MWPFSSHRNPYRETIEAKRARRAEAIKLAPPFNPEEHQKYLNATGNCTVLHLAFMPPLAPRLASPRSAESIFFRL
jgi:hypothetical protein